MLLVQKFKKAYSISFHLVGIEGLKKAFSIRIYRKKTFSISGLIFFIDRVLRILFIFAAKFVDQESPQIIKLSASIFFNLFSRSTIPGVPYHLYMYYATEQKKYFVHKHFFCIIFNARPQTFLVVGPNTKF